MTWSNLRLNVLRSFVTMATNLPSCFLIEESVQKMYAFTVLLPFIYLTFSNENCFETTDFVVLAFTPPPPNLKNLKRMVIF